MSEKLLTTGLRTLDKELDGGLYPGTLVYILADSMTMSEIFLYGFMQQRNSYYVNTERRMEYIITNLQKYEYDESKIKFIDVHKKYYEIGDKLVHGGDIKDYMIIDFLIKQLKSIDAKEINLIIDTITFFQYLKVKRNTLRNMIDVIYDTTKKMEGLCFLYGLKGEKKSDIENEIINICDAVFDISLTKKSDKNVTELTIPKARDRPIHGNVLKFKIEGGIIMDTSKEIA